MSDRRSPQLLCAVCGAAYADGDPRTICTCGGLLSVEHDLARLNDGDLRRVFAERWALRTGSAASGVWRYRELLGDFPAPVSRPEGNTPLYTHRRLTDWAGAGNLLLKHEGENPTGSFKDRGMTVGVSQAVKVGARAVVCASTGNTSSSLASYAALAGLPCVVFVPQGKIASGKLAQSIAYGAHVIQMEGDFDVALTMARAVCQQMDLYLLNSINPWRIEGQKTIIFELLQQLDWQPPDWIVVPGGNLGNTSAFGKALRELHALGMIERLPRLAVIQAAGANPFVQAFRAGFRRFQPVTAHTIATAINIGDPANYVRARQAVQDTDGLVDEASDAEIMEAKAVIDRAGIGCEPASAATLTGVRKLARAGVIKPADTVVGILTGHILKDPESTVAYHGEHGGAAIIASDSAAVRRVLERILA
jgi:threonine synthase